MGKIKPGEKYIIKGSRADFDREFFGSGEGVMNRLNGQTVTVTSSAGDKVFFTIETGYYAGQKTSLHTDMLSPLCIFG